MGNQIAPKLAVIIPWYDSGDPDRQLAFDYVKQNIESWGIAEIFIGESDQLPLNRSAMRNAGAWRAISKGHTKLFFNDADSLVTKDQILKIIDLMDTDGVVYPYNHYPVHLTKKETRSVYNGQPFMDYSNWSSREISPSAGNFGCNSNTFVMLDGLDMAFRGWGYEDADFTWASRHNIQRIRTIDGPLIELYHPASGVKNDEVGPYDIQGTPEWTLKERNRIRYLTKLRSSLERRKALNNKELFNIVVPVVRHGMAKTFMPNTVFPVHAVVYEDDELAEEWLAEGAEIIQSKGHTFAQKCNQAFEETNYEYTLYIGEDVEFEPDWYRDIHEYFGIAGVVGTNDLLYANELRSAHLIVSRQYVLDFGGSWDGKGILFHDYIHNFVDTETIAKARGSGQWRYAPNIIIKHNHPDTGRVAVDEVYTTALNTFNIDRLDYQARYQRYN